MRANISLEKKLFEKFLQEVRESFMMLGFGNQPLEIWMTIQHMGYKISHMRPNKTFFFSYDDFGFHCDQIFLHWYCL